jgi:hypothetical protein
MAKFNKRVKHIKGGARLRKFVKYSQRTPYENLLNGRPCNWGLVPTNQAIFIPCDREEVRNKIFSFIDEMF